VVDEPGPEGEDDSEQRVREGSSGIRRRMLEAGEKLVCVEDRHAGVHNRKVRVDELDRDALELAHRAGPEP